MNRLGKRLLSVTLLASATWAGAPLGASGATCYGLHCDGQDPKATGCYSDAETLNSADLPFGVLETRYSATCDTVWARAIIASTSETWTGSELAMAFRGDTESRAVTSDAVQITAHPGDQKHIWTKMVGVRGGCVRATVVLRRAAERAISTKCVKAESHTAVDQPETENDSVGTVDPTEGVRPSIVAPAYRPGPREW